MMAFYWSIRSIPEMRALPRDQQVQLARRAGGWRIVAQVYCGAVAFDVLGAFCTAAMLEWLLGSQLTAWAALAGGLAVAAGYVHLRYLFIRAALRYTIKRIVAGERLPYCLGCGYDLTATTGSRCPECGAPVVVPPHA